MVWHVHHKDGKYQIWSTIVDDYLLTEWVDQGVIHQVYVEKAIERAHESAQMNIDRAKKHWCSGMLPLRCDLDWPDEIRKWKNEDHASCQSSSSAPSTKVET